jgi:hypothetical protein
VKFAASLHFKAQYPHVRNYDYEVDLTCHSPLVTSQIERMKHGPPSGCRVLLETLEYLALTGTSAVWSAIRRQHPGH